MPGANIPASDPFRLTPLLLAKLKMDNLRQLQYTIHHPIEQDRAEGQEEEWLSESAKSEYDDLKSVSLYSQLIMELFLLTIMLDYSSAGVSFSK